VYTAAYSQPPLWVGLIGEIQASVASPPGTEPQYIYNIRLCEGQIRSVCAKQRKACAVAGNRTSNPRLCSSIVMKISWYPI
jgi:hypothetical protein